MVGEDAHEAISASVRHLINLSQLAHPSLAHTVPDNP